MKTLTVDLGDRSYPIFIGAGIRKQADCLLPYIKSKQVMLVSNETIAPLYLNDILALLTDFDVQTTILKDGEQYKTSESLYQIFDGLLAANFNRNCTLIALGGGVVGDITGFAAAAYQRGVNFIQIPTTLLSQVDSSVGGKTGINHPLGKNMIGAFHQPQCVIADTETLSTLPDRELPAGIAEVIKYGLIRDAEFFSWLEANIQNLLDLNDDALIHAIEQSCRNKAEVVAADELESGQRALLNLGHTFGHAIETATGYGTWLHGEAVGCGMLMAAKLSREIGWMDDAALSRTEQILQNAKLPLKAPAEMDADSFLALMKRDKKVLDGTIRLVLLKAIGNAVVTDDYPDTALRYTLENA